ncbi:MAG: methyltransferase regulatory domain-containing protein [Maricaulaceae bacterium]
MQWAQGYIADIPYFGSFYKDQGPPHLRLAALVAGRRAPQVEGGFRCLELGCGPGLSLAVMAAANPDAEFVGIDYNPGHVATGRRWAREGELDNLTLIEGDFGTLAQTARTELGEFDFVVCHGVYTWVGEPVRAGLRAILEQCVLPGGLVYMGYNAAPGWTSVSPLQKLMLEHARLGGGRSDERAREAVKFAKALRQLGGKGLEFGALPEPLRAEDADLDALDREHFRYVAHEYLCEHWSPMAHIDMARDMSAAKLSFVGSAVILEQFPETTATPEQRQLLATLPAGPFRELVKDVFSAVMFRKDIFMRGDAPLRDVERNAILGETMVALTRAPEAVNLKLQVRVGEVELPRHAYEPVIEKLAEGPQTIADLEEVARAAGGGLTAAEIAGVLVGSHQVNPVFGETAIGPEGVRRFNEGLCALQERELGLHHLGFAARLARNGLELNASDALFYRLLAKQGYQADAATLTDALLANVRDTGAKFNQNGVPVEDPTEEARLAAETVDQGLKNKLPIWRTMGVF